VMMTMADMASAAAGRDGAVASGKGPRAGQPKRRTFTPACKARILQEYDALETRCERGALLRREGRYSSHIGGWRKSRGAGTVNALDAKSAGALRGSGGKREAAQGERETRHGTGADESGARGRGKSTRALGTALPERGLRHEAVQVTGAAITGLEPLTSSGRACELLGKSRATLHRQCNPKLPAEKEPPAPGSPHPAALSWEQQVLLAVLDRPFAGKSLAQVYAILLDEGIYLAFIRTMWSGGPEEPLLPAKVWISKPRATIETQETRQVKLAA
jgi:transposase